VHEEWKKSRSYVIKKKLPLFVKGYRGVPGAAGNVLAAIGAKLKQSGERAFVSRCNFAL